MRTRRSYRQQRVIVLALVVASLGLVKTLALVAPPPLPRATPVVARASYEAPSEYRRRYHTLAHTLLDMEAEARPVAPLCYELLDRMIDAVHQRVGETRPKDRREGIQLLREIDETLTAFNVVFPPGEMDVDSMTDALTPRALGPRAVKRILSQSVNARRAAHIRANADQPFFYFDCDMASLLYLSIAESMNVPLRLVDLPDHMFVRFPLANSALNWDTNEAAEITDEEYRREYALSPIQLQQKVYLTSLTDRQVLGYAHSLRATRFEEMGDLRRAVFDYRVANLLYPQDPLACNDLAWHLVCLGDSLTDDLQIALRLAQQAAELEPEDGDVQDTFAVALARLGRIEEAVAAEEKALRSADSRLAKVEFSRRLLEFRKGRRGQLVGQ